MKVLSESSMKVLRQLMLIFSTQYKYPNVPVMVQCNTAPFTTTNFHELEGDGFGFQAVLYFKMCMLKIFSQLFYINR